MRVLCLTKSAKINLVLLITQWAKSPKKQSVGVYLRHYALYFVCQINKNALLQTVILAILPTG